ncbi:MAG: hypothetical protein ACXWLS_08130 [Myxococcaceae bacterium]
MSASRLWGIGFLVVLALGLGVLSWLTFRPPPWGGPGLFARAGALWIMLLTVTARGVGRGRR